MHKGLGSVSSTPLPPKIPALGRLKQEHKFKATLGYKKKDNEGLQII